MVAHLMSLHLHPLLRLLHKQEPGKLKENPIEHPIDVGSGTRPHIQERGGLASLRARLSFRIRHTLLRTTSHPAQPDPPNKSSVCLEHPIEGGLEPSSLDDGQLSQFPSMHPIRLRGNEKLEPTTESSSYHDYPGQNARRARLTYRSLM